MEFETPSNKPKYFKACFYGEPKAGKTTTAALISAGLCKEGDKVGFIDTEGSAFAVVDIFNDAKIEFLVNKQAPSNFNDIIQGLNTLLENRVKCIIIDSVTHIGDIMNFEVLANKNKKLRDKGKSETNDLSWSDRNDTGKMKKQFTKIFLESSCHFILCGRPTGGTTQTKDNTIISLDDDERTVLSFKEAEFDANITAFFKRNKGLPSCKILSHRSAIDSKDSLAGKVFDKPSFKDFESVMSFSDNKESELYIEFKNKIITCNNIEFLEVIGKQIAENSDKITPSEKDRLKNIYRNTTQNLSSANEENNL
jgi:hypothetical protein